MELDHLQRQGFWGAREQQHFFQRFTLINFNCKWNKRAVERSIYLTRLILLKAAVIPDWVFVFIGVGFSRSIALYLKSEIILKTIFIFIDLQLKIQSCTYNFQWLKLENKKPCLAQNGNPYLTRVQTQKHCRRRQIIAISAMFVTSL